MEGINLERSRVSIPNVDKRHSEPQLDSRSQRAGHDVGRWYVLSGCGLRNGCCEANLDRNLNRSCVAAFGLLCCFTLVFNAGCTGSQSALGDAGLEARQISRLFYWMLSGAAAIWLFVVGLAMYAVKTKRTYDPHSMRRIIIGGGAIFPTLVLTALLSYGLSMMPDLQRPAPEGSITIRIAGVRWWWRVHYLNTAAIKAQAEDKLADTELATDELGSKDIVFEMANELVLPVGESIEFKLTSEDVIHSFWIPSLGGKMDMVPGRENRLKLRPLQIGTYRGVCAEYCGEAHSQMSFIVKVVEREEFDRWIEQQRQPAKIANARQAGLKIFLANGCGACHTIRGTEARGVVAPDLTHVGSRATLAAGWLPNDIDHLHQWLKETKTLKPGVEMPQFNSLSEEDVRSLAKFLEELK